MIDIETPLEERDELDMLELVFYLLRAENDGIAVAIEQTQAAAVELQGLIETGVVDGSVKLKALAASNSLLEVYKRLLTIGKTQESALKGLGVYLKFRGLELYDSMEELRMAQEILKEMENPSED